MSIKRLVLKPIVAAILVASISSHAGDTPTPPITCPIALTGAYVGGFGLSSADISDKTFSITAGTGGYGASTDVTSPTPVWTGTRIVSFKDFSNNGLANIRGGIVLPDGSKGIFFNMTSAGDLQFRLEQPVGTPIDTTNIDELNSEHYAVGINFPSGDAFVYIDGTAIGGIGPYAAFFSGATGLALLGLIEAAAGGTASMTFITAAPDYAPVYTGVKDWCDNAI